MYDLPSEEYLEAYLQWTTKLHRQFEAKYRIQVTKEFLFCILNQYAFSSQ
jgi:hypothetical protein